MSKKLDEINQKIADTKERLKQLNNSRKAQEQAERPKKDKADTQRKIIIGGIVEKYFPEVLRFQPKSKAKEKDIEFAPLAYFLSELAADKEVVERYKARAQRRMETELEKEKQQDC